MQALIDFASTKGDFLHLPEEPKKARALMVIQDECTFDAAALNKVLGWCMRKDCHHIAFVGASAKSSHDIFDDMAIKLDFRAISTWHLNEEPAETVNFFLNYFNMDGGDSCRFVVLLCGGGKLQSELVAGMEQ